MSAGTDGGRRPPFVPALIVPVTLPGRAGCSGRSRAPGRGAARAAELARVTIRAAQASATVALPDCTTKPLSPGPSQPIIEGVIEQFAPRLLTEPVVLSYSDSAAHIQYIDAGLC